MTTSIPTASETLIAALEALNDANLHFVVLRNHEGLPYNWSNDIDILVDPATLEQAHNIILAAIQQAPANRSVEVMRRLNFRATRLTCADRELQIDLYSQMSKAWVTYADTKAILHARQSVHSLFSVPDPTHEALLIAAKELFSYREIRQRYHSKLAKYDTQQAKVSAKLIFGSYLSANGRNLVVKALKDPRVKGFPSLTTRTLLDLGAATRWARMRKNVWVNPQLCSAKRRVN